MRLYAIRLRIQASVALRAAAFGLRDNSNE